MQDLQENTKSLAAMVAGNLAELGATIAAPSDASGTQHCVGVNTAAEASAQLIARQVTDTLGKRVAFGHLDPPSRAATVCYATVGRVEVRGAEYRNDQGHARQAFDVLAFVPQ